MKSLNFLLLFFISSIAFAQDTLVVQTFTWDSTSRAEVFDFPDNPGETYRKILMKYNMRCHDAAVGNGAVGCREWDYHCNTIITDSTRVDSVKATHPTHVISNYDEDTYDYSLSPTYNYTEYLQYEVNFPSGQTGEEFTFNDDQDLTYDLGASDGNIRMQTLISADRLLASGITAGPIEGLKLFAEGNSSVPFLRVRMKTLDNNLSMLNSEEPILDDLSQHYFLSTEVVDGENHLKFYQPFEWDGSSSILIDLSYTSETPVNLKLASGIQAASSTIISDNSEGYVNFTGSDQFEVDPSAFEQVDSIITISFWARGAASLPANTFAFEGVNANNVRQASVHLPWSDANVYWDCGNDGSGYDRVSKGSFTTEFRDVWTHWAFVKNAKLGVMAIYQNGEQWVYETGKFKIMDIERFVLGTSNNNTTGYLGDIDELRIWNTDLDRQTIADLMHTPLSVNHPYHSALVADFDMDEFSGNMISSEISNAIATSPSSVNWRKYRGKDKRESFHITDLNPKISLVQGDFSQDIIEHIVLDSTLNATNRIISYTIIDNNLVPVDTIFYYPGGQTQVFDEDGELIRLIDANMDGQIEISNLNYFNKWPGRVEILSFITPYGNGLDLGPEGKTFTIDVTDYAPILKGKKRMSIEGVGRNQEELDIKFLFIKGVPHAHINELTQIWPVAPASQLWSGSTSFAIEEDRFYEPRNIMIPADAGYVKLKSAITGHGSSGEFDQKTHYMNINGGFEEAIYSVWKECADNPVYPQGGTWIFDRAGWCPGMATDVNEFEIAPFLNLGEMNEFDYGITTTPGGSQDYRVNNQMVIYAPANFNVDAELYDIINPSKKTEYARRNPSCNNPAFIVRNTGTEVINTLSIEYGLEGGQKKSYDWSGNIRYLESKEIELSVLDHHFWESSTGDFYIEILSVNGEADEYADNNKMTSEYSAPFTSAKALKLDLRTDNKPSDTRVKVFNSAGDEVLSFFGLGANQTYSWDLDLPGGCYTMQVQDFGDDGLDFWFFPANGLGWIRLTEDNLPAVSFDPDFGGDLYFDFIINGTTGAEENLIPQSLAIHPNPVSDELQISWFTQSSIEGTVQVIDHTGKLITQTKLISREGFSLNTSDLIAGMYYLRIISEAGEQHRKFVKI